LIGLLCVESVFRYYFIYMTSWLGQAIIKTLRTGVFDHIIRLRLSYFDSTPIGTSTTRTINDVETVNDIFSQGLITMIGDILVLISVLIMMFITDWRLSLVCLTTFPILLLATYVFKEKVKVAFQMVRTQVARLNAFLQEHISGMSVVQIFNAEQREMRKFEEINKEHRHAHIQTVWYYSIFFPVVEIILAIATGLMIWWGAHDVIADRISMGVIFAFILYLNMLFRPVRLLADKFNVLQMGMVASERIFNVLDNREVISNTGELEADNIKGSIKFENVHFAYIEDDYVLKNVNFEVEAGKTLAIVGATGSGKTSIINILNRFYEINQGRILIDGTDIKEYEITSLRSQIGLVLQDVFLFSGSIMDNITLRDKTITEEQVIKASKIVGAHNFIIKLPGQYNYNVMERGLTLSMGQRQLVSFVRALVFDPRILILDEATSSIDAESEELIKAAIKKLVAGRTSIVIAHRLSTIQHANTILVVDHGKIAEQGTHNELLQKNGLYKLLYEMQFKTQGSEIHEPDQGRFGAGNDHY
ncbi:MAG: ABC transporter ATP-binding protein, partial [Bacteroidetes bacterium]|nr:ABC transporter ATP-binding protein [Bacteroidota bacterium]